MSVEKLIITKDDVSAWVDVSGNLEEKRLDRAIADAQILDLRPFIGDPLYLDLINKVFNQAASEYDDYQALLYGTTYTYQGNTIKFYGIAPALVHWAYARYLSTGNLKATRAGLKTKFTEQSQDPESKDILRLIRSSKSQAGLYSQDIRQYLDEKNSIYPLWNEAGDRRTQNRKALSFHRVQPVTKDGRIVYPEFTKLPDEE